MEGEAVESYCIQQSCANLPSGCAQIAELQKGSSLDIASVPVLSILLFVVGCCQR